MGRFFFRLFFLLIAIAISIVIFLTYIGLETDKFDDLIKNKTNEINNNVKLDFIKTKIHLNPTELNLVVKLQKPKILIKNNEINLSKLDLFLSLKNFFNSDFLLKRAEVEFVGNDIKDLTKVTSIFFPRFINKKFKKIFEKGNLEGKFSIPFEPDGTVGKTYDFSGKMSDASINITKKFLIRNLTAVIERDNEIENNGFVIAIKKGSIFDLELADSKINFNFKKNATEIKNYLRTNGKLNFSQIKIITSLFGLNTETFRDINGNADLRTKINFDLDKKFKIKNLSYSMNGKIDSLELIVKDKK